MNLSLSHILFRISLSSPSAHDDIESTNFVSKLFGGWGGMFWSGPKKWPVRKLLTRLLSSSTVTSRTRRMTRHRNLSQRLSVNNRSSATHVNDGAAALHRSSAINGLFFSHFHSFYYFLLLFHFLGSFIGNNGALSARWNVVICCGAKMGTRGPSQNVP